MDVTALKAELLHLIATDPDVRSALREAVTPATVETALESARALLAVEDGAAASPAATPAVVLQFEVEAGATL